MQPDEIIENNRLQLFFLFVSQASFSNILRESFDDLLAWMKYGKFKFSSCIWLGLVGKTLFLIWYFFVFESRLDKKEIEETLLAFALKLPRQICV